MNKKLTKVLQNNRTRLSIEVFNRIQRILKDIRAKKYGHDVLYYTNDLHLLSVISDPEGKGGNGRMEILVDISRRKHKLENDLSILLTDFMKEMPFHLRLEIHARKYPGGRDNKVHAHVEIVL